MTGADLLRFGVITGREGVYAQGGSAMRTRCQHWGVLSLLVMGLELLLASTDVRAETLKWRQSQHTTKTESIFQVGDVPDHIVGVGEGGGLAFFENGEFATFSSTYAVDYTNGSGAHWAYSLYTFEDGSGFVTKEQGTTAAQQSGKISVFKGTFSFIEGRGRFKGVQGSGSYTGRRLAPLAARAEGYRDFTATYTLP